MLSSYLRLGLQCFQFSRQTFYVYISSLPCVLHDLAHIILSFKTCSVTQNTLWSIVNVLSTHLDPLFQDAHSGLACITEMFDNSNNLRVFYSTVVQFFSVGVPTAFRIQIQICTFNN
jgi:hypothetical protein